MDAKDKDVSCFTLDGVVAEMVIEVEDSHKTGLDDLGMEISPTKSNTHTQNDANNDTYTENEEPHGTNAENEEPHDTNAENEETNDANAENEETNDTNAENDDTNDENEETNDANAENDEISDTNTENLGNEMTETDSQYNEKQSSNESSESNKESLTNTEIVAEKESGSDNISSKYGKVFRGKRRKKTNSEVIREMETDNNSSSSKEEKISKGKRKKESSSASVEDEESLSDQPRYPGRKRQVNKKYISEDLIPEKRRSDSVQSKEIPKEEKKRKVETDSVKKKLEVNEDSLGKSSEKSSNLIEAPSNIEVSAAKKDGLRKLPFRKNKDAPDVPDLYPKVRWWNGVGEGKGVKLGSIPGIRDRITSSRSVRNLFRILYFQFPATDAENVIEEILKFNGFPFDKTSFEYTKRQGIMKIMLDKTIANICEILGLKKDTKQNMIANILNFLLKPYGNVGFPCDLKPVVLLERLVLDTKFFSHAIANSKKTGIVKTLLPKSKESPIHTTPVRTTRNSAAKVNIIEYHPKISIAKTRNSSKVSSEVTPKETPVIHKKRGPRPKESTIPISEIEKPRIGTRTKSQEKSKINKNPEIEDKSKSEGKSKNIQRFKIQEKLKNEEKPKVESKIKVEFKPKIDVKIKAESKPNVEDKMKRAENSEGEEYSEVHKKSKANKTSKKVENTSSEENSSSESEVSMSDPENEISKIEKEIMLLKLKKKMALQKKKMAEKLKSEKKIESKDVEKVSSDNNSKQEIIQTVTKKLKKKKTSLKKKETVVKIAPKKKSLDTENKKILTDTVSKQVVTDTLLDSAKSSKDDNKSEKITLEDVSPPSDSSATESSEEAKEALTPRKNVPVSLKPRVVQPLKAFSQICDSIQNASFSALQRLHILLFGASDKADNLKGNILAFGGFPFLEGSDEWKQKHFLLSLLAQNNLREYLNLLCIEHNDNDQPAMINKLMRFLAAPSDHALAEEKIPVIETEVISSELVNISPQSAKYKGKVGVKKRKKKDEPPKVRKHRKILMTEEEAKKLEANFAREQRALARDSNVVPVILKQPDQVSIRPLSFKYAKPELTIKPKPIADENQLNALLQTVYKRRALKDAGAVISTPNKGVKTKLSSIENIKFLVVTSNFTDLELLHRLIFLSDANKGRIRKNILDFDGFGFTEDSDKYKERMDLLNKYGYDVSKRLSFLLGLCPLDTKIPQLDLNELIMYFLMSPCKTKQVVPITQMPASYSPIAKSKKVNQVPEVMKQQQHNIVQTSLPSVPSQITISSVSPSKLNSSFEPNPVQTSTPIPPTERQKAKKSFNSSSKMIPMKKVLLPPSESVLPTGLSLGAPGKIALPNPVNAVSPLTAPANSAVHTSNITTLEATSVPNTIPMTSALSTAITTSVNTVTRKSLLNPPKPQNVIYKVPVLNTGTNLQVLHPGSNVAVFDSGNKLALNTLSNISHKVIQNPALPQPVSNVINPMRPLLAKNVIKTSVGPSSTQEFIVQQQTPDGQQKTFKLIRLPANHPLATAVKPSKQTSLPSPVQKSPIFSNASSGLILMKPSSNQNIQNILQSVPVRSFQPGNKTAVSITTHAEEFVLPDEGQSANASASNLNDPDVEVLSPLVDSPPADIDLFTSIQEIILGSNFEDITLRNVIERVSAQYPHHDLTPRHNYMKECVKKIIIGSS